MQRNKVKSSKAKVDELPVVEITVYPKGNTGTPEWYQWLTKVNSFRFVPLQNAQYHVLANVTVRRTRGDYWYGYRRVNGRLRQVYVGKTNELDFDTLQIASEKLSQNDVDWYHEKAKRKANREAVRQKCTTGERLAKLTEENRELKVQVADLRIQAKANDKLITQLMEQLRQRNITI